VTVCHALRAFALIHQGYGGAAEAHGLSAISLRGLVVALRL